MVLSAQNNAREIDSYPIVAEQRQKAADHKASHARLAGSGLHRRPIIAFRGGRAPGTEDRIGAVTARHHSGASVFDREN